MKFISPPQWAQSSQTQSQSQRTSAQCTVHCTVGCEYGDRVFWCQSYPSLDCTDPLLRHDCCQTCASTSRPPSTLSTTSFPLTTTTTWRDVTDLKSTIGSCPLGDGASFCATMPSEDCYYFSQLCCVRCVNHYTGIPGFLIYQILAVIRF